MPRREKGSGTHFTGGRLGRSARVRKISPQLGFDSRTLQPVAIRYADPHIREVDK